MRDTKFKFKPVISASVGSAIEFFDFAVYGLLAPTIGPLFFPHESATSAILFSLAIMGSAFLARPLGGVVLGRLGDKLGRSPVLIATVLGMGGASTLIGMLPTYAQFGRNAAWLLLFCRLLQGFFSGAEASGAATYISELAPPSKRGYYGAFNPVGVSLGLSSAAAAVGLTHVFTSPESMIAWGWRIPFLTSALLVVVGIWLRRHMEDTERFQQLASQGKILKAPLGDVLRNHKGALAVATGIALAMTSTAYLGLVYFNIYLTRVNHYNQQAVYWLLAIAPFLASCSMPFFGGLSDRLGRRPLLLAGFASYCVLTPIAMHVMSLGSSVFAGFATIIAFVPYGIVQAVAYPCFAELFPANVRYTGVSLGFNLGSILGGAATPFVCTWLIQATDILLAPAYYIMISSLIGFAAAYALRARPQEGLIDELLVKASGR